MLSPAISYSSPRPLRRLVPTVPQSFCDFPTLNNRTDHPRTSCLNDKSLIQCHKCTKQICCADIRHCERLSTKDSGSWTDPKVQRSSMVLGDLLLKEPEDVPPGARTSVMRCAGRSCSRQPDGMPPPRLAAHHASCVSRSCSIIRQFAVKTKRASARLFLVAGTRRALPAGQAVVVLVAGVPGCYSPGSCRFSTVR